MTLPLYNHAFHEANSFVHNPGKGNTGQWYNKFFSGWQRENWQMQKNAKLEWIKKTAWKEESQEVRRKIGDSNLLSDYIKRIRYMVQIMGGETRIYSTKWYLVTGLGLSHPIENGLTWHHTLGVPYLPGSTIKGIVKTWAEEWEKHPPEDVNRIFGSNQEEEMKDNKDKKNIGTVIFFDSIPVQPVQLTADIMTSHYQEYYSSTEKLPGDWYNPNPIPFLAVESGQLFLFAVAPRKEKYIPDMELILKWLDEALTNIGVGAKTATGYGRFISHPE